MRNTRVWIVCAAVVLFLGAHPASAAIIVYSDAAAWQAAVTGVSVTTFEENATGGSTFKGTSATFDGITYGAGAMWTNDPDFSVNPNNYALLGTGDVLVTINDPVTISGLNTTALAFDYYFWATQNVTFTLSTGDVIPLGVTFYTPGFFGVTSTTPITSLTINFPFDILNIDNVAVGTRVQVPEPASLLLLGAGVLGTAIVRRRARR